MEYEKDDREAEIQRYLRGLRRYTEKGIPIYMDGRLAGPSQWEKLFEIREDGMFYMGDYVQADAGGLKEIRFDRVYLAPETRKRRPGSGRSAAEAYDRASGSREAAAEPEAGEMRRRRREGGSGRAENRNKRN